MSFDADKIPLALQGTQIYEYAKNEVDFKKEIRREISFLRENINFRSDSFFILNLLQRWLKLPTISSLTKEQIHAQLLGMARALKNAGTHDSLVELFRVFLGVEVLVNVVEGAGVLKIQMLNEPTFEDFSILVGSENFGFLIQKNPGEEEEEFSILSAGKTSSGYETSFFFFLRSIVAKGVVLEIVPPPPDILIWDEGVWDEALWGE